MAVANLDKNRPGDAAYRSYLRKKVGPGGVLFLQESGHGLKSTQIVGVKHPLDHRPHWVAGDIGVHRGIARAWDHTWLEPVRYFSSHGLHVRTSGRRAQNEFHDIVAERLAGLTRRGIPWVYGTDANAWLLKLAKQFGGTAHGPRKGRAIEGFIVSPRMSVRGLTVDDTGKRCGWTDHPAVFLSVKLTLPDPPRRLVLPA